MLHQADQLKRKRRLSINLDELAFVLHRGPGIKMECFLNLQNGNILNIPSNDDLLISMLNLRETIEFYDRHQLILELLPAPEHHLFIPDQFYQHIFTLMSDFAEQIRETHPGLFRKYWYIIHRYGEYDRFIRLTRKHIALHQRFLELRDSLFERNARQWLRENHIAFVHKQKQKRLP